MKKLILIAIATVPAFANANLISNGSFEDHDAFQNGNWGLYNSVPGWYAEQDKIEIGTGGLYGVTGFSDAHVLELDANNNAKVSQDLNLSAGSYALSFDYAGRNNIALSSVSLDVLWNDVVIGSLNPASTAMTMWSGSVASAGGMNKLSFVGNGTNDSFGALVDNVQVTAVPEPGTIAALAMGAVVLIRRRKK